MTMFYYSTVYYILFDHASHNIIMSYIRYYDNILLCHRVLDPLLPCVINYIRYYDNALLFHCALDPLLPRVT